MTDEKKYNLDTARYEGQLEQMKDLITRGICNFCREHIETEQREPIELETEYWLVKKNDYPYEGSLLHLMLVPLQHVKTFSELSTEAQADFGDTITAVEKKWKLGSYALGMRSGDMKRNGGSVEHLHAHIVVGDTDATDHQPVRFKMSSKPKG